MRDKAKLVQENKERDAEIKPFEKESQRKVKDLNERMSSVQRKVEKVKKGIERLPEQRGEGDDE